MIGAATLAPVRRLFARVLELPDIDAACALLVMQGKTPNEVATALSKICAPGGDADRIAAVLDDPQAARKYAKSLGATFAPFAEILRGTLPDRGKRYTQYKLGYRATTAAAMFAKAAEKRRREEEWARRYWYTREEAAHHLGIARSAVQSYLAAGELVGVYRDGQKRAYGVTRASVEAHAAKVEAMRSRIAANAAKREQERQAREEDAAAGGRFYTEDGRAVFGRDRISAEEAAAVFGVRPGRVTAYANAGHVRRVFIDEQRHHAVGFERATVEAYAARRATGTYYTERGAITGAERLNREDAAALIGCKPLTVAAIARRGEIARTFADPQRKLPCGFTRASVEAWAQAHPRHIPAKRAQAVADFMIEVLPPKPRAHHLHAARLEPETDTPTTAATQTARRTRQEKPPLVFTLHERNDMDNTNETTATPTTTEAAAKKPSAKLEIAKAYTVHEAGYIRAICVSEEDRDEIVAALALYRRIKATPGEIESALALYRTAKGMIEGPQRDGGQAPAGN